MCSGWGAPGPWNEPWLHGFILQHSDFLAEIRKIPCICADHYSLRVQCLLYSLRTHCLLWPSSSYVTKCWYEPVMSHNPNQAEEPICSLVLICPWWYAVFYLIMSKIYSSSDSLRSCVFKLYSVMMWCTCSEKRWQHLTHTSADCRVCRVRVCMQGSLLFFLKIYLFYVCELILDLLGLLGMGSLLLLVSAREQTETSGMAGTLHRWTMTQAHSPFWSEFLLNCTADLELLT